MLPVKLLLPALSVFITAVLGGKLTCDGDYSQNGKWCYKLMSAAAHFIDADQNCKALGMDVVSIHSEEENDYIASFGVEVFIGLQYHPKTKNYTWTDGTPLDIKIWEEDYPMNPDFYGDCVKMQKSGKWVNFECSWGAAYVCKTAIISHQCPVQPNNQFFNSGEVTSPAYPENYISGLSCTYQLLVPNEHEVTIEISEMMMGDGDTIEIYSRLIADNAYRIAVLSGNLTGGPKEFTTPNAENRMLVKFTSKSQNGGYWKFSFKKGHCPKGWIDGGEAGLNHCYESREETMSSDSAKSWCESEGAQMISIHNAFQNRFIIEEACDGCYVHLGLVHENGSWKWRDGSDFQYTSWKKGQPKLSEGNCVMMTSLGEWLTGNCSRNYGYYPICYRP